MPLKALREVRKASHGDASAHADWARPQTLAFLARLTTGLASPMSRSAMADDICSSQSTVSRGFDELREPFVL